MAIVKAQKFPRWFNAEITITTNVFDSYPEYLDEVKAMCFELIGGNKCKPFA